MRVMCACVRAYTTTIGNPPTIDVRSNIKIKQYSNSVNTNRSRLVCGLESTEAMCAVSLSALAYAVT